MITVGYLRCFVRMLAPGRRYLPAVPELAAERHGHRDDKDLLAHLSCVEDLLARLKEVFLSERGVVQHLRYVDQLADRFRCQVGLEAADAKRMHGRCGEGRAREIAGQCRARADKHDACARAIRPEARAVPASTTTPGGGAYRLACQPSVRMNRTASLGDRPFGSRTPDTRCNRLRGVGIQHGWDPDIPYAAADERLWRLLITLAGHELIVGARGLPELALLS